MRDCGVEEEQRVECVEERRERERLAGAEAQKARVNNSFGSRRVA